MQLVRKTWNRMICTIILLLFMLWSMSVYMAFENGSMKGYELGRFRAEMDAPLRPYVESEKPFCYDGGIIYTVRRGTRGFYPEFDGK